MDMRKVRRVIAGLILFGFVFVLSGCAIDPVWDGVAATDFSNVYAGMLRTEFESLTGRPIEKSEVRDCVIATYEYDRGYIGCVASGRCQEPSQGGKAFRYYGLAFGSLATAGALPWSMWHEVNDCQTGYLGVRYGPDGRLINIRLLDPEPYKGGTYFWDKDIRKPWLGSPCREVYYHPRPSTIPEGIILVHYLDLDPEVLKSIGEPEQLYQSYYNTITIGSKVTPAHESLCQSADKGNPDARYRLGLLFEFGHEGFKKDFSKAYLWYALAGESGKYRGGKNALRMKKEHLSSESFLQAEDMVRRWKPGQCELDLPSKDLGN
jgi:TPR repeat protein